MVGINSSWLESLLVVRCIYCKFIKRWVYAGDKWLSGVLKTALCFQKYFGFAVISLNTYLIPHPIFSCWTLNVKMPRHNCCVLMYGVEWYLPWTGCCHSSQTEYCNFCRSARMSNGSPPRLFINNDCVPDLLHWNVRYCVCLVNKRNPSRLKYGGSHCWCVFV